MGGPRSPPVMSIDGGQFLGWRMAREKQKRKKKTSQFRIHAIGYHPSILLCLCRVFRQRGTLPPPSSCVSAAQSRECDQRRFPVTSRPATDTHLASVARRVREGGGGGKTDGSRMGETTADELWHAGACVGKQDSRKAVKHTLARRAKAGSLTDRRCMGNG
jgi:hypothetical protein